MAEQPLKFAPLSGALDVSFLTELSHRKLHVFGLDDAPVDIYGLLSRSTSNVASPLLLSADAFSDDQRSAPPSMSVVPGTLRNVNTLEDFKELDKASLLAETARKIADDIASGAALAQPERLLRFLLLTFADLKAHKYYYWFAFPAFAVAPPPTAKPPVSLASVLTSAQIAALTRGYLELASGTTADGFLDVASDAPTESENGAMVVPTPGAKATRQGHPPPFFAVYVRKGGGGGGEAESPGIEVGPLSQFAEWAREAADDSDPSSSEVFLAFGDPCPLPNHPGWPLRNLLALASSVLAADGGAAKAAAAPRRVRVICFREPLHSSSSSRDATGAAADGSQQAAAAAASRSMVLDVSLPECPPALLPSSGEGGGGEAPSSSRPVVPPLPSVVGWEKNSAGKLGPRMMDLSRQMDPVALADASADLNLRLMRWRQLPALQPEHVASTKCLLFGAGTLGCAVARCLMGWGVRHVTFIDSGTVSYSNPVRQSLFEHTNCVDGGAPKAQAAADALLRIHPTMRASAHRIGIPMPGHAVGASEAESVKSDCAKLDELVQCHDVVFLLTDTRESRWLPSLLAARYNKMAINAALGFDSLMVMRHGCKPCAGGGEGGGAAAAASAAGGDGGAGGETADGDGEPGLVPIVNFASSPTHLGCYFCNDVVAPANSMLRRTLDQQCTVSRPGLSMIASALAVELMVSLLHHPLGAAAEADLGGIHEPGALPTSAAERSPLGCVPHQLRASLPTFRMDAMVGRAFDKCTACSPLVLDAYKTDGFEFLLAAFNRATFLEDHTGLSKMHAEAEAALQDVCAFDDDDEEDDAA